MGTPDEEHDQYVKDPRTECKFGVGCYQKNPLHHQKYKHPPKKRPATKDRRNSAEAPCKKFKANSPTKQETCTVKISNDISESDESSDEERTVEKENVTEEEEESASTSSKVEEKTDAPLERTPVDFDKKAFIKEKFLVDMPEDFYTFWDFCKSLSENNPANAFSDAGLTLVGPYDVLADKFSDVVEKSPKEYLVHWRYFYDPPEFQTVIKGSDATGYHIGYFRDDPKELPVFLASNHGKKDGEFTCMGENIFAAVSLFLEETKKSCNPFKKMSITKLQTDLKNQAEKLKLSLSANTANIQERNKKILTRTFNKVGLVVPYNRKTQLGYRHLSVSDKELKKLLDRIANASVQQRDKVISEFQPILTATSIAADECDFGTSIELGWNILAHGVDSLNTTIARFLGTGYRLLQREVFAEIAAAHMSNRRKEINLTIL